MPRARSRIARTRAERRGWPHSSRPRRGRGSAGSSDGRGARPGPCPSPSRPGSGRPACGARIGRVPAAGGYHPARLGWRCSRRGSRQALPSRASLLGWPEYCSGNYRFSGLPAAQAARSRLPSETVSTQAESTETTSHSATEARCIILSPWQSGPARAGGCSHDAAVKLDDSRTGAYSMDPSREMIGRSPKIMVLRDQVRALVTREAGLHRHPPLLITGETGTGKGLLANIIHRAGSRASGQFVELNGAALPEHLLESELFGYERGAFTDARQSKPGLLQVANRGTLFLDEVGLLPPTLQAKLLKVLEDSTVRRLGSTRSEPIDVSFISATNADLPALVRAHRFREDLYHRLAVITLWIPPLRERGDDIELLAEHAIAQACAKYAVPLKRLSPEALAVIGAYHWPGNVRELNSLMERVALLCPDSLIPTSALALQLNQSPDMPERETRPRLDAAEWERQNLAGVLAETGWNITRTAVILGITRNTVRARIAKHGLRPTEQSAHLVDSPAAEGPDVTATSSSDLARFARASESGGGYRNRGLVPSSSPVQGLPPSTGADATAPSPIDLVRGRPSIAVLPFRDDGEN